MRYDDNFPFSGLDSTINQVVPPNVEKVSATSISVKIKTEGMQNPGSISLYKATYQLMSTKKVASGSAQAVSSPSNPIIISGLVQNGLYKITTQVISVAGESNLITRFYRLSSESTNISKIGTPKKVGEITDAKSYLKITGGTSVDDNYTLAYRTFESIQLPNSTSVNRGAGYFLRSVKDYSVGYYSFGTSLLMPSLISGYEAQGAGIGFFLNPEKGNGYFVTIDTTGTAANSNSKPIKIFKLESKQIVQLETSQKGNASTLDSVFGGRTYNIDIRVKIEDFAINITAYINGFKVTASDTTELSSANTILDPTKIVGLVGSSGTSMFDYVYATNIEADQYDDATSLDFYKGQFTKDFLDISYGDMVYNASVEDTGNDEITEKQDSFDEFGTVVREIARRKVKFPSRPSIPITFTTGANNLAHIISQTFNSFGGDVFVLNNSSVTVPLSDQETNDLSIMGYTIGFSGDIEYATDPVAENALKEPVIFESQWLHYESDVKELANWIRGNIVNKAKIIEMEIFGNPLISVGDIITIDYPYQGFTNEQKIIVVKVSHSYSEGLTTKIVGRTI